MKDVVRTKEGDEILFDDGILDEHRDAVEGLGESWNRLAYTACHLVMKSSYQDVPHHPKRPGEPGEIASFIDWEKTLALRKRRTRLGFGIAEAMDTAQRFEIGWEVARELISRGREWVDDQPFIAGAGVDHRPSLGTLDDWLSAMRDQVQFIQAAGGVPILLPSVWLAREDLDGDRTVEVYRELIESLEGPLFLHWLGEIFMSELRGLFSVESFSRILAIDPAKVRGAKISLLDAEREKALRAECLERSQIILTGDDLHFGDLILGEDEDALHETTLGERRVPLGRFSHALLGVFDGTVEPIRLAMKALSSGQRDRAEALLRPCEALGRHVFQKPVPLYKAGLAFLCWLDGEQDDYQLVNHLERLRSREYYCRTAMLGARAGVFRDAALSAVRLRSFLDR